MRTPRRLPRQRRLQRIDEPLRDIETALLRYFLEAGRTRHVDLGQAIADHVEADQQEASCREHRPDALGDLAIARAERLRDTLAADREVAADLAALRDAREGKRHRHAVD